MAYSGAWKRSQGPYYFDPDSGQVHTADRAHAVTDAPDPIAYVYTAPLGMDYTDEPADEFPGLDCVVQTSGLVLDTTPGGHNGGDTAPLFGDDAAMMRDAATRHGVDFGASRANNYEPPDTRAADETFTAERFEQPARTEINPVALQRGLNSLDVNNPQGFRAGFTEWFRPNRRIPIGERRHDHRPLTPNTAYLPQDAAPVPTPYGQPFARFARAITSVNQTPVARRDPTGISRDVTSDAAAESYADVSDWVVG